MSHKVFLLFYNDSSLSALPTQKLTNEVIIYYHFLGIKPLKFPILHRPGKEIEEFACAGLLL
jgi:hypothetical protein